jgi:hypothetical protein
VIYVGVPAAWKPSLFVDMDRSFREPQPCSAYGVAALPHRLSENRHNGAGEPADQAAAAGGRACGSARSSVSQPNGADVVDNYRKEYLKPLIRAYLCTWVVI